MKFFELIFIINIVHLIGLHEASQHTWGKRSLIDENKLVDMKLIEYNSTTPKNHTIIYQYYQSFLEPVAYIKINVNSESDGYIKQSTLQERYYGSMRETLYFTAYIHINNTKNTVASLTIYEDQLLPISYFLNGISGGPRNNKSLTFLYTKDAFPSKKSNIRSSIGKRQTGDQLVHFESRNVTNQSRFPSKAFSYNGEEYLTCVRFSFNSPTAIALVNTSFIGEQDFNAIVYDMNAEHFAANFSVFGIKSTSRPNGFSGIVNVRNSIKDRVHMKYNGH